MFTITTESAMQAVAFSIDALLLSVVVLFGAARLKRPFIIFLLAAATWSFVSFMSNQRLPFEQAVFWGRFVAFFAIVQSVAYAYFIATYVRNKMAVRLIIAIGGTIVSTVGVLVILGYVPQSFVLKENGLVFKEYGKMMFLLGPSGFFFLTLSLVLLIKNYRKIKNPDEMNRTAYLILGVCLIMGFGLIYTIKPTPFLPLDQVGHLANAVVITLAVIKHRLVDVKILVRKGAVYTGITFSIISAFALLFLILNRLTGSVLSTAAGIAVTTVVVILMAILFNPIRVTLEKGADRLIYGNKYDYRQMVRSFASRMSNVIEINELAESMLRPITNALSAKQSNLLLANGSHFGTRFAERLTLGEPSIPINLRADSPIITWFEKEDEALCREKIDTLPEFRALWQEDRNALDAAEVELLCPIKSKRKLIAILSVSRKQTHGYYSRDDVDMLMTLAHEAAVVIENAHLYEKAKQRANTDELTGLFNHRYFHQRLNEEIDRCSRFGDIFSLVFLDMDVFKSYNDINGHLAGDEILRKLGQLISKSIRSIDLSFRYGGDEFAVILPATPFDGASKVAERIRKGLEAQTDMKGMLQTCSIGIASWPTDGVMREEIIRSADAALYYAKHIGGNRVCLACEVALSDVLRIDTAQELQNRSAILSTIYALAATVDAKDHHTYGHSKKVSKYATDIAEALGYSKEGVERIRTSALLHDIGKIGVSDSLLTKQEALTADDWEAIRAHPTLGVSILKHVDSLKGCLAAVQYHHEHYDGTGYPAGLKGDNIPFDARILAICDAFDAMTSQRPYRSFKATDEEALAELARCAGTQFDPAIVDVFLSLQKKEIKRAARTKGISSKAEAANGPKMSLYPSVQTLEDNQGNSLLRALP